MSGDKNLASSKDTSSGQESSTEEPQRKSARYANYAPLEEDGDTVGLKEKVYKFRNMMMTRLKAEQFDQECSTLAQFLLGKVLARRLDGGKTLKGIIVETEAYLGGEDKASHSYNGKITDRNKPMYAPPGTSYVYSIYGMYFCINISSGGPGAAVLLRALEPIDNVQEMHLFRDAVKKNKKPFKDIDLCSGPSKLCISLHITKELNNVYMPDSDSIWIEEPPEDVECRVSESAIVRCPRIGIEKYGAEWAAKHLRYYLYYKNVYVSKRDKKREKEIEASFETSTYFSQEKTTY